MKIQYITRGILGLLAIIILPVVALALPGDVDPQIGVAQCTAPSVNLRYRDRDASTSNQVSTLQDFLQSQNYLNSEPTGYFGLLTVQAAKSFQSANGIDPTGYVGPITRAKIAALCASGVGSGIVVPSTATTPPRSSRDLIVVPVSSATISIVLGDVSLDGQVTIGDAQKIGLHVDGITLLTGQALANADVTGEGRINSIDSVLVAQYAARSITSFPKTDGSSLNLGDANRDGRITIGDSVVIGTYATGNTSALIGRALDNADVNGDGRITDSDATLVANYAGCLINSFSRGVTSSTRTCTTTTQTSCSLALLNNSNLTVGQNASWAVTSNPQGLRAYWYGTKNGTSDVSGLYAGVTDLSQTYTYQAGDVGAYTRYLVLKDSAGNSVCTTNTIGINISAQPGVVQTVTIPASVTPSITLLPLNASGVFPVYSGNIINIAYVNNADTTFYYEGASGQMSTFIRNTTGGGNNFNWTVPEGVSGTWRIRGTNGPTGDFYSPSFTVLAATPTPAPTPVISCSFALLGSSAVRVGQNLSWAVTSSPEGLSAYWYGTKNGTTDANGLYAGVTDFTQTYTYQAGDVGSYTRYLVLKDSAGNNVCTTSTLSITVSAQTAQASQSNLASVLEALKSALDALSKSIK